jgi:hypothetical protein
MTAKRQNRKWAAYSITSSARAVSNDGCGVAYLARFQITRATPALVDEHSVGREQVDPALQIFPFGNRIGVTNSGHIVIFHELFFHDSADH